MSYDENLAQDNISTNRIMVDAMGRIDSVRDNNFPVLSRYPL